VGRSRATRTLALIGLATGLVGCPTAPEEPEPECPDGEHGDGDVCVPERCGVGRWGDLESLADGFDGAVVRVAPEGRDDADGTADDPFDDIDDAIDDAEGGLVLVAAGVYRRSLTLDDDADGVTVAGRCSALTVIEGETEEGEPAITLERGVTASLRGLQVVGGRFGIYAESGGPLPPTSVLDGEDLLVRDSEAAGMVLTGAVEATLRDSVVRDVVDTGEGWTGRGIMIEAGAVLRATGLLVEGTTLNGISLVLSGSHLELSDSVIRRNHQFEEWSVIDCLGVFEGATAALDGVLLEECAVHGVTVSGGGASVDLRDVEVRNTRQGEGAVAERASWDVGVEPGGVLTADGLTLVGGVSAGLLVAGEADVNDVTVRGLRPREPGATDTVTVSAVDGGDVVASDLLVEDCVVPVVISAGAGSHLELSDAAIHGGVSDFGWTAIGLQASEGGELRASDVLIDGLQGVAVLSDIGGTVDLEAVTVRDSVELEESFGAAFSARNGGLLTGVDLLVERVFGVGLYVEGEDSSATVAGLTVLDPPAPQLNPYSAGVAVVGGELTVDDALIRGSVGAGLDAASAVLDLQEVTVQSVPSPGGQPARLGPCLQSFESDLSARSVELSGCWSMGLSLDGSVATLDSVTVRDVQSQPWGFGVSVLNSHVVASGLLVERAWHVGVLLSFGATAEIEDSTVRETRAGQYDGDGVGMVAQYDDVTLLGTGLLIEDNEGVANNGGSAIDNGWRISAPLMLKKITRAWFFQNTSTNPTERVLQLHIPPGVLFLTREQPASHQWFVSAANVEDHLLPGETRTFQSLLLCVEADKGGPTADNPVVPVARLRPDLADKVDDFYTRWRDKHFEYGEREWRKKDKDRIAAERVALDREIKNAITAYLGAS